MQAASPATVRPLHYGLIREDLVVGWTALPAPSPLEAAQSNLRTALAHQRQTAKALAEARRMVDDPPRYTSPEAAAMAMADFRHLLRQAESAAKVNDTWVANARAAIDALTLPLLLAAE